MKKTIDKELLDFIKTRSCTKRDAYENVIEQFEVLKQVLKDFSEALHEDIHKFDERIRVKYIEKSKAEVHLVIAGDVLVFHMHSNIFLFDKNHHIWQSSYVQKDEKNAFVGSINVYNFLNDSIQFNRQEDLGYMIARIFINKEDHFFVEGKKELGYKFNDFTNSKMTKTKWREIVTTCIMHILDFNLLVPPYRQVSLVTVAEVNAKGADLQVKTGKRLGFQFNDDSDKTT